MEQKQTKQRTIRKHETEKSNIPEQTNKDNDI